MSAILVFGLVHLEITPRAVAFALYKIRETGAAEGSLDAEALEELHKELEAA
ncbi:MAG: hypothetical protein PVG71_10585 [Anaerolineae bacterium]